MVLIDVDDLHARLGRDRSLVLLDVRWSLGDPHGRRHYLEGHIPGAVYVDLEAELSGAPSAVAGRHPLPTVDSLQAAARSWGIDAGSPVVAYDDAGNLSAARAWWLLRWGGLSDVSLLDGGLSAWRRAGHAIESSAVTPEPGDVTLTAGHLPVLDADEAAQLAVDGILLDARAPERFRGDAEPIDPKAGHIPGAVSAPAAGNLDADGAFEDAAALAARFRALGVDGSRRVGAYCGSGVTAAHEIAALAIAGFDAALYPGSWSQWSSDESRPVAVGD
ncbi:MAG: thiosulfate sulfurtransferase match [Solirubrobacterales bacterium]|nr:thiosulfate sulfurtransferase match [Solirubrobacterales bacterium]